MPFKKLYDINLDTLTEMINIGFNIQEIANYFGCSKVLCSCLNYFFVRYISIYFIVEFMAETTKGTCPNGHENVSAAKYRSVCGVTLIIAE